MSNYNNNRKNSGKKRSGATKCKVYVPKSGPNKGQNQYKTIGWSLHKGDLIKWDCTTTTKSELSQKGWLGSIACTRLNNATGEEKFFWGTMQQNTGKVVIDKLSLVLNPNAPNGGYCGSYVRSKN